MTTELNIIRHMSVFDPSEHNYPIHIIGCGATGSHVFANLVNLGCQQIHCYDFDKVESHNLPNQIYTAEDIGRPKVNGCARYYERKVGSPPPATMQFHNRKVNLSSYFRGHFGGVVFLLTDTMESRRTIFEHMLQQHDYNCRDNQTFLVIETRMASTHGAIYSLNPFDSEQADWWLSTLVDDNDPDAIELSPCGTTLSVGTTASTIANLATMQMVNYFVDPLAASKSINIYLKPTILMAEAA